MSTRQYNAKQAIGAVFLAENITAPITRAAFDALEIPGYDSMYFRRVFGSWDRGMKMVLAWTATKVNLAPTVVNALVDQTVAVGGTLNYQFASNSFAAPASETEQTLTYEIVAKPEWVTFTPATRTFGGTPPVPEEETVETVTVRARDDFGRFVDATFTITTQANLPPIVVNALVDQTVAASGTLSYQFASDSFAAPASEAGQTLTYEIVTKPEWVTFTAGTRTFGGTAPAYEVETVETVTVRALDDFGSFVDDTFTITVTVE